MMFADLITSGNQISKHHKNSCEPHSAEKFSKACTWRQVWQYSHHNYTAESVTRRH